MERPLLSLAPERSSIVGRFFGRVEMKRWQIFGYVVLVLALIAIGGTIWRPTMLPAPDNAVQAAWQLAQQAGVYRFAADVVQTTRPAPALANVGQGSRRERLR